MNTFGEPIPADLDPAFLLNELRAMRPLMLEVRAVTETIQALKTSGITPADIQAFALALQEYSRVLARLDTADEKMDRIDELITLLDQLDVIVRRQ